jgi:hypothetical protein
MDEILLLKYDVKTGEWKLETVFIEPGPVTAYDMSGEDVGRLVSDVLHDPFTGLMHVIRHFET